jgi:hypothetical protein
MHGLDVLWFLWRILERLPDFSYTGFEDGVTYMHPRPQAIEESFFGHELAGMLDQIAQYGKRFGFERRQVGATPQLFVGRIKTTGAKGQDVLRFHLAYGKLTVKSLFAYDFSLPSLYFSDIGAAVAQATS